MGNGQNLKPPVISVIMAVYNGEKYLAGAIESILGQTFRDFEFILIDDGSNDDSRRILKTYGSRDSRIRLVVQENVGLTKSLNIGLAMSRGEYIARMDADDISVPNRFERQLEAFHADPDLMLLSSNMSVISGGEMVEHVYCLPQTHEEIRWSCIFQNPFAHPSVMFKGILNRVHGISYNECFRTTQDYELWERVMSTHKVGNLQESLVHYRRHEGAVGCLFGGDQEKNINIVRSRAYERNVSECGIDISSLLSAGQRTPFADSYRMDYSLSDCIKLLERIRKRYGLSLANHWVQKGYSQLLSEWKFSIGLVDALFVCRIISIADAMKFSCRKLKSSVYYKMRSIKKRRKALREVKRYRQWIAKMKQLKVVVDSTVKFHENAEGYKNCDLGPGTVFEKNTTVWICKERVGHSNLVCGRNVYVGSGSYLGVYEDISIGDDVLIGAYTYIISGNHRIDTKEKRIRDQGYVGGEILIKEGAWIGAHVTILPKVTIGRGAVIGAGSVVTKSVPDYEIWGGVPAKKIKGRI